MVPSQIIVKFELLVLVLSCDQLASCEKERFNLLFGGGIRASNHLASEQDRQSYYQLLRWCLRSFSVEGRVRIKEVRTYTTTTTTT